MPTSEEFSQFMSEPVIAALGWLGLSGVARLVLSPRTRIASLSPLAGVFAIGLGPAFSVLASLGSSIFVGFIEAALLMADLTLFFGPVVVAVARVLRGPLGGVANWKPGVAYLVAVGTGLAACWSALAALWWVTEIKPDLVGSVEVAVFGGVATACIALVRTDGHLQSRSASIP